MMRRMVSHADQNVGFKYVLADSWFSSSENMACITKECGSDFIMAIKSYRVVALSATDKAKGNFISIGSLELEGRTMPVYLKQYDNPVLIGKPVFKNGDGTDKNDHDPAGTLYRINDSIFTVLSNYNTLITYISNFCPTYVDNANYYHTNILSYFYPINLKIH